MSAVPFFDLAKQSHKLEKEFKQAFLGVLRSSEFILGGELKRFEQNFASFVGTSYAVGVNSGLDALLLSLKVLNIGPGDEVIVPANSFIATALAVSAVGATPVFVDADPTHLLIDPSSVKQAISPATKAVIPVHLYGQAVDMDALQALCGQKGIAIVEDAAQAHGAKIGDKCCGSFGVLGCFSFYPGKNLGAFGDGGMITTSDKLCYEKLLMLRNYGSVIKYEHPLAGFNTRLDTMQAAFLNVKLPHLSRWNEKRNSIARFYRKNLKGIPGLDVPRPRKGFYDIFHQYVVRTDRRDELKSFLQKEGVGTGIHYPVPIHKQGAYLSLTSRAVPLPVCEREASRVLSLPIFPEMTRQDAGTVCDAVRRFFGQA